MKTRFFIILVSLFLMFMLTIPMSAQADPLYEYTYTSGPLGNDLGPDFPLPASSYSSTISFTFGAITQADLGVNIASLVSNFTASVGPVTFTTVPTPLAIVFGSGPAYGFPEIVPGEIPDAPWYVLSYGSTKYLPLFTVLANSGLGTPYQNAWPTNMNGDTSNVDFSGELDDNGWNNTQGVWTVTPIPEPASIVLLVLGCLGLAPAMRSLQAKRDNVG
jgi:hypothetical protein